MAFKFYPLGIPESSSFSIESKFTQNSGNTPATASLAQFAVNNTGPTGPIYQIVFASEP